MENIDEDALFRISLMHLIIIPSTKDSITTSGFLKISFNKKMIIMKKDFIRAFRKRSTKSIHSIKHVKKSDTLGSRSLCPPVRQ